MAVTLPAGFAAAGTACGIKANGSPDLGIVVAEEAVEWAGTFTRNAAAAAPVRWCRETVSSRARAIVVNSGNANACTGSSGDEAVRATARAVADALGCTQEEILVASTGPIGVPLPTEKLTQALPDLAPAATRDGNSFAQAILTTDTVPKTSSRSVGEARVVGIAKGAAMLAPNMATMLAFVLTDADIGGGHWPEVLRRAVDVSFNRISVDACESTNDSVLLLSSGRHPADAAAVQDAVTEVCSDLAEQMVRDAEGGSRFVRVRVEGAADDHAAVDLGKAVAASALWRAAVHGGDPNWGRVLSALGSCDRSLDLSEVSLRIGDVVVFEAGQPRPALADAAAVMAALEFTVTSIVGSGTGKAEVLTTDLSPDYVKLNAEGTS